MICDFILEDVELIEITLTLNYLYAIKMNVILLIIKLRKKGGHMEYNKSIY